MKYTVRINLKVEVEADDPSEAVRTATIYCLSSPSDEARVTGLMCSTEPTERRRAIIEAPFADQVTVNEETRPAVQFVPGLKPDQPVTPVTADDIPF